MAKDSQNRNRENMDIESTKLENTDIANRKIQIIWIFRTWRINKSGYIEWNMDKRWIDRRRIYRRYRYIRQILGMRRWNSNT